MALCGMHWRNNCTETDYHCTIGPPGSEMEFIHTVIEIRQNGDNVRQLLYVKIRGMTEVFINGAMRSRCCGRYVPTDDKETHC